MVKIQSIIGVFNLVGAATAAAIKARDCSFLWTAADGDTCDSLSFMFGISTEQFTLWNQGVKCSFPLTVGKEYCLLWDGPDPTPTGASTSTTSKAPSSTTKAPMSTTKAPTTTTTKAPTGPQPTQDGIAASCNKWHQAVSGDTCSKIVDKYKTFNLDQFYSWNPAVGNDCSSLWLGYQYCISVPGSTVPPPTTTTKAPTGPQPTQEGIANNCQKYHQAVSGDTCAKIVEKYKTFTLSSFYSWNPAVGNDCSGLWLGYQYCIGIPGTPTVPPISTKPSPTQDGISSTCNRFHLVVSGNICQNIANQYGISLSQLYSWNPAVGTTCASLWSGYYVCVGVSA